MTQRIGHLCIFLLSLASLLAAYYFQVAAHISPCILCIMQRICFYLIVITAFIALLRARRSWVNLIYDALLMLFSAAGIYYASRQVWLQHLPAGQVSACPPSFNYLLENFPLSETLKFLFYGSSDCALVTWRLFSLSMAEWSLIILTIIFISSFYFLIKAIREKA